MPWRGAGSGSTGEYSQVDKRTLIPDRARGSGSRETKKVLSEARIRSAHRIRKLKRRGGIQVEEWAGFGEIMGWSLQTEGITQGLEARIQKSHVTKFIRVACGVRCIELPH